MKSVVTDFDEAFWQDMLQETAEDVAGQILQCLFAIPHAFDVNHPVRVSDFGRDCCQNGRVNFY